MAPQGKMRRAAAVAARERLQWAHDRMMDALRRAARDRADPSLVTAALARAQEYDDLLAASLAHEERERRDKISRARRSASLARKNIHLETT